MYLITERIRGAGNGVRLILNMRGISVLSFPGQNGDGASGEVAGGNYHKVVPKRLTEFGS